VSEEMRMNNADMPAMPVVRISHHEREIRTATMIVDQAE
jgi:hypothetical protein